MGASHFKSLCSLMNDVMFAMISNYTIQVMSHPQFLGQQGQIAVIHLGGSVSNITLSVAVTSDVIGDLIDCL